MTWYKKNPRLPDGSPYPYPRVSVGFPPYFPDDFPDEILECERERATSFPLLRACIINKIYSCMSQIK